MSDLADDVPKRRAGAGYRRDRSTWAAFAALLAFGFLNAVLGPALPYLRVVEHTGYVVASLHQVAFAIGGGLAGLVAARRGDRLSRSLIISVGLVGAGIAGLGVGYGNSAAITIAAAFLISLLGTSALVRLWASVADAAGVRRVAAMTEGEVWVSVGGIVAPLLVGGLAATALSWRFAFVVGAIMAIAAVAFFRSVRPARPGSCQAKPADGPAVTGRRLRRLPPTLTIVFAVVALEFSLSFWLASYLHDSVGLGRQLAVLMVAGLYAANLVGRLAASRLARRIMTQRLLAASLLTGFAGLPVLLAATSASVAATGLVLAGAGIGAAFPLASSLHAGASAHTTDAALGQVFATAATGQVLGPLTVGVIARAGGLRLGLLVLPALALIAAGALARHRTQTPIASQGHQRTAGDPTLIQHPQPNAAE
jgi:MFS family permease